MITRFLPLFTVRVQHAYYAGHSRDFAYVRPEETAHRLRQGRLLAKELDGVLHVLFESDDSGKPIVSSAGRIVRFGLQLRSPYFGNITELAFPFPAEKPAYTNFTTAGVLAQAGTVRLSGRLLAHTLRTAARPATVTLRDAEGEVVQSHTVTSPSQGAVSFALDGRPFGLMEAEETSASGTTTTLYYHDPELVQLDAAAIVEIEIDDAFHAAPPDFTISFAARSEPLSYYVVATNHSSAEFNDLSVADEGFTEDGRAEITFQRIASSAFTAAELSAAILAGSGERVALFRSAPVARRERARTGIQLSRDDEVLIANLPQPGADRTNAALIVHVSKP